VSGQMSANFVDRRAVINDALYTDREWCASARARSAARRQSCAPVAQLDRASASGAEGRGFESPRARHCFRIS
jgi:hypothetical protein